MSTANAHPGLSFGGGGGLRRGPYAPPNPPSKPSPQLPQHASPYQPQAYPTQQASQGGYPHHFFSTPNPPQVPTVASVQNGARPSQPQPPPSLPGPRQRVPAPRQMQPQPTSNLSYLQQSLSQLHSSQQQHHQPLNPQQLSQQSLSQQALSQPTTQPSLSQQVFGQQSLGHQSLGQQHVSSQQMSQQSLGQQHLGQQSLSQPLKQQQHVNQSPVNGQSLGQQSLGPPPSSHQSIGQQPMTQQAIAQQAIGSQSLGQQTLGSSSLGSSSLSHQSLSQPPVTQSLTPQSMTLSVQPIEAPLLSQKSTPLPPSQPTLPPTHTPKSQVQQVQKAQQAQPAQQHVQHPTPPLPEPNHASQHVHDHQENHDHHDRHDDTMDLGSQEEGEDGLEPRMLDGTTFVPRSPMGALMSPPPEGGSFPTLEAVHKHVLAYCTSVGYAIVIGRSKKTVPGLKKVLFVCDRAGKPPRRVQPEMRKRKTSSRKCDCQFGFFAIEQRAQWIVRYRPDPVHLKHNHGPSESPLLHPAARKLDSGMVARVKALKESGVGVSQTLEILQGDNPHVPLLPRDIYNARAAINRNPTKVATGLAENRPAIYSKPHPSAEERIRADLRRELAKAREDFEKLKEESQKEIEDLKNQLRDKDAVIQKFEMFIDICNQRVFLQRERLADGTEANGVASSSGS